MQVGQLKTIQLIRSFDSREADEFSRIINQHKRSTLQRLYSYLNKQNDLQKELDKAQLFEFIFKKSYREKQDYLLRNELRLLNNEIYQFLAKKQFEAYIKKSPELSKRFLLAALKERELYNIFETNYKKEIKQSLKDKTYQTTVNLIDEYFDYTKDVKEINTSLYKTLHELLNDQIVSLKKSFVTKLRKIEANRAFIERSIQVIDEDFPASLPSKNLDLTSSQLNDSCSKYMYLKGVSYHTHGHKKIDHLKKGLELLKSVKTKKIDLKKENIFCLGSVGLEFFLMGKYKKADQYYYQAFQIAIKGNMKEHLSLLFNYVSNLVKLGKYKKGIKLINEYWKVIKNNKKVYFRFECLRAMCYVHLNKPEEAFQSIPPNISQRPQPQYHYFRFIYSIIFYLRDDVDNAAREINNFHQTLKKKDDLEVDIKPIVSYFKVFYNISKKTPPSHKKLLNLQNEIQQFTNRINPALRNYLPFHWLRGMVQKKIDISSS